SANATKYKIYYGTTSPPAYVTTVTGVTSYTRSTALSRKTKYYWNIEAVNDAGTILSSTGPWNFTTLPAVPGSFSFSAPANNATNVSVTPALRWTASSNATSYDVYYGIASPGTLQTTVTTTGYTPTTALAGNTKYYWQVIAKNSAGSKIITYAPRNFTTTASTSLPGSFSQTAPASGATGVVVTPTFTWGASSGATSYDVYYGTTSPGTLQTNVTGTSYTPATALANNTTYYWKIVAKNASGSTTATGAPLSFTTIANAPGAFNQTAPASGATGIALTPTFTWGASSGATSYDVYYGTTSPGTLQTTVATTSYTPTTALANNTTYYWKIIAKNAGGSTTATGAPLSFTTIANAPAPFSQVVPLNAIGVSVTPTFTWEASTGATSYDLYYGTTSPGTLQTTVTTTSYTPTTALAYSTKYYWKIVAKNASGSTTATGAPWSFTTQAAMPGAFSQTTPAANAAGVSVTPTLIWTASAGAVSYDVYCYIDSGTSMPTTPVASVTGTSYTITTALANNTTYKWLVMAKNENGVTLATGAPLSFTTMPVDADIPVSGVFYYDNNGQLTKAEQTINTTTYTVLSSYDTLGRVTDCTYPDGTKVYNTYSTVSGGIQTIGSTLGGSQYLKAVTYNDYGLIASKTLGNNVTVAYSYDPNNLRLNNVTATNGGGTVLLNLHYTFSNRGAITGISDITNSYNWSYQYDDLYRLTNARRGTGATVGGGTETYNKSYTYDTIGNIMSFEGTGYTYGDSLHKHAVTAAGTNNYTYDENGNMLSGAGRTLVWNYDNKPVSITKNNVVTTLSYGPTGNRVKKQTGSNWKVYVAGGIEIDQVGNHTIYVDALGTSVKKKSDGSLFFMLKDHLGGTNLVLNAIGNVVNQQFYQPYGSDDATGSFENEVEDYKFTGQEADPETGLYNYKARMYDPALGRFISADPVEGLNRYAYALNDPVNLNDPSGNQAQGGTNRDLYIWMQQNWSPDQIQEACHNNPDLDKAYAQGERDFIRNYDNPSTAMTNFLTMMGTTLIDPPAAAPLWLGKAAKAWPYIREAYVSAGAKFNTRVTAVATVGGNLYNGTDTTTALNKGTKSGYMTYGISAVGGAVSLAGADAGIWAKGSLTDTMVVGAAQTVARIFRDVVINGQDLDSVLKTQGMNYVINVLCVGYKLQTMNPEERGDAGNALNMFQAYWGTFTYTWNIARGKSFYDELWDWAIANGQKLGILSAQQNTPNVPGVYIGNPYVPGVYIGNPYPTGGIPIGLSDVYNNPNPGPIPHGTTAADVEATGGSWGGWSPPNW
ncbi:MAG: RHS repeat-associated core domain-containing protein, partial [Nitrospirota bacterium]